MKEKLEALNAARADLYKHIALAYEADMDGLWNTLVDASMVIEREMDRLQGA